MQKISMDGKIIISRQDLEIIKKSCYEKGYAEAKAEFLKKEKTEENAKKSKTKIGNAELRKNIVEGE